MVVSYSIPTLSPSNTIHQPQVLNSIPLVKPHVDVSETWLFMFFSLYLWPPWPFRRSKNHPETLSDSPRPERHDVDLRHNVLAALGVDLLCQQGNPLIHLPTILDTEMLPWVPYQWGLSWCRPSINCHVHRENMIVKGSRGTIFSDKPN